MVDWRALVTKIAQHTNHSHKLVQAPNYHISISKQSWRCSVTWWLGGHHGWRGSYIGVVRRWRRREGRVYSSCATSNWLLWRLSLQLVHQTVHHIYAHWWGWIIIFIDRTSASILIAVHKHVQECLESWKTAVLICCAHKTLNLMPW